MAFVLLKILVTTVIVVALSMVAERVSPRVAGVLAGYPLGAAIVLFFIGLDIGPAFAAESAVYTLAGLVGTLFFVYVYYLTAVRCSRWTIAVASASATAGYFVVIGLLHTLGVSPPGAAALTVVATVVFFNLFRKIADSRIEKAIRLTFQVVLLRAFLAALTVVVVTGAAHWVGSRWTGLFAAFPITLFPLMLIVHFSYGKDHVYTIIKNFPRGLGALILYTLIVSIAYPRLGVVAGTLAAFAAATAYLCVYAAVLSRLAR